MGKALLSFVWFPSSRMTEHAPHSLRAGGETPERASLRFGHASPTPVAAKRHALMPSVLHRLRSGKLAQREDAFWHAAFSHEPYYAPGRSYDQYRPAYALGWQAAFHYAATDFAALESALEHDWQSEDTGSLLPWSQVRAATEAAWIRGQAYLQHGRVTGITGDTALVGRLIGSLRLQLLQASGDMHWLLRRAEPASTAFVYQVVERHAHMLAEQAKALPSGPAWDWRAPLRHLGACMQQGRMRLLLCLRETDSDHLLHHGAQLEARLLAAYQALLALALQPEPQQLLQRQAHQLQLHHDKLQWMRQHWSHRSEV